MKNPVIYIILNGELKMSPGKAAAQAVHAAMMLSEATHEAFLSDYKRTVVVLEAKDTQQLKNLSYYLESTNLDCEYYIDEGVNEVSAYSATALAVGPIEADDTETRAMFESFPLYKGNAEVVLFDNCLASDKIVVPNPIFIDNKRMFKKFKKNNV